jgi:hypothetical protein
MFPYTAFWFISFPHPIAERGGVLMAMPGADFFASFVFAVQFQLKFSLRQAFPRQRQSGAWRDAGLTR